jgi:hypothetical protein
MDAFELWSSTLFPHQNNRDGRWYVAFEEDGYYYGSSDPLDDFYMPVPDSYATEEGAEAAIAVLKVWDAPVANDDAVLDPDRLRATPEWDALAKFFPEALIGDYDQDKFDEAFDLTGAHAGADEHYRVMLLTGVPVSK